MFESALKYCRIHTVEKGASDFSDESMALNHHPNDEAALISAGFETVVTKFLSFKAGAVFDWHTAPCRQFLFVLKGHFEVEVSDGEKRKFNPGDVLFVEDTEGQGHITRVLGDENALIAVCPLK